MKKLLLFFGITVGALLSSVVSASAQQYCTAGASQCSYSGYADGQRRGESLCGNLPERERVIRDTWALAEQAQNAGRSDDYAYWSSYSDSVAGACPFGGRQLSTSTAPANNPKDKTAAK